MPVGCDALLDSGDVIHVAIFPVDAGCVNPECERYRVSDNI